MNDPEEPIQIKDAKGSCANYCVGADLSSDNEDENINEVEETTSEIQTKIRFDLGDNESKKSDIENSPHVKHGAFKTALFWICGIESSLTPNDDVVLVNKVDTSIDEDPFWSRVCDINAIVAIGLCTFCFAFMNKFD